MICSTGCSFLQGSFIGRLYIVISVNTRYNDSVRVVSETQCIKDEIFAYRAESARQNCGVLGIVTSIW